MVDEAVLARKIAAVQDAVDRIREVLPESLEGFLADRSAASRLSAAPHFGNLLPKPASRSRPDRRLYLVSAPFPTS